MVTSGNAGLGAGETFLDNSIALVNTADKLMKYRPCWHISLPCNCDFERPPPQEEWDTLYVFVCTIPRVLDVSPLFAEIKAKGPAIQTAPRKYSP